MKAERIKEYQNRCENLGKMLGAEGLQFYFDCFWNTSVTDHQTTQDDVLQ